MSISPILFDLDMTTPLDAPEDPLRGEPSYDAAPPPLPSPPQLDLWPAISRQRPKQYKRATASRFCHMCGRKVRSGCFITCSRIHIGLCRKVVCSFCVHSIGAAATGQQTDGEEGWVCPHCRGRCGVKAQCHTYGKTNYRRHLRLSKKRQRSGECELEKGAGG